MLLRVYGLKGRKTITKFRESIQGNLMGYKKGTDGPIYTEFDIELPITGQTLRTYPQITKYLYV